jgi:hypothetical protein
MVFQRIDAVKYAVVERLFPEVVPEMLHGIEFRRVGRKGDKSHVAGNCQQPRGMPTGSVKNHDDPIQRMPGSHFVEEYLHPVAVDVRKNQTVELAISDGNSAIGVRIFLGYHAVAERTDGFRTPTPSGVGDTAETRFILEHYPERPFVPPLLVDL